MVNLISPSLILLTHPNLISPSPAPASTELHATERHAARPATAQSEPGDTSDPQQSEHHPEPGAVSR